ncbi:MAG: ImmA/IrrE family metallo-endopeptidase [Pseudomonadota bacterium]
MSGRTSKKTVLTPRRRLTIMEGAQNKRSKQADFNSAFDPLRFAEQIVPKDVAKFDFDYFDEHEEFRSRPELQAFVEFNEGCTMVVRSSVMEQAYRGDKQSRFIICHELGHVYLHKNKAAKIWRETNRSVILGRHTIQSRYQYLQNPQWELEANLFAGTLLAPPLGISQLMNTREIRMKYNCSDEVATQAKKDAELWRAQQR